MLCFISKAYSYEQPGCFLWVFKEASVHKNQGRMKKGVFMYLCITPWQAQHSFPWFQTSLDLRLCTSSQCCVFILPVFRQMCFVNEAYLPHPICSISCAVHGSQGAMQEHALLSIPRSSICSSSVQHGRVCSCKNGSIHLAAGPRRECISPSKPHKMQRLWEAQIKPLIN